jgi:hypothetical protein
VRKPAAAAKAAARRAGKPGGHAAFNGVALQDESQFVRY